MRIYKILAISLVCILTLNFGWLQDAQACSRVVDASQDKTHVATGRSLDWLEDIETNLWLFPRGMERDGAVCSNSAHWTSKYGSVIAAGFDVSTGDGLNEKGLMANLLYLAEADFGERDQTRPGLSWSILTQYILDNFATVAEAVEAMEDDYLQVVASPLPGTSEKPPTLHVSISDITGDSAIFEYIEGKLVIHHGEEYPVMTNSPPYDQQIALNTYWESVGGEAMLPGTRRASDRYVRASYYASQLPEPETDRQAIANVMSVIRNVSVPFGESDPNEPNLSETIWRTIADHVNKTYYFESTLSPNVVWVEFKNLDFGKGAPVKKLNLVGNYDFVGEVSGEFVESPPFDFTGPCSI
ncbi:MAG: linear amide C-N hydrolase [Symploca sp. SIO2E9]|nr:linear amide C-N hydrolase [Symploca sp. SIO2E9]